MATDTDKIQAMIDRAIRRHELRVALISGTIGAILLTGVGHAFWLLRTALQDALF